MRANGMIWRPPVPRGAAVVAMLLMVAGAHARQDTPPPEPPSEPPAAAAPSADPREDEPEAILILRDGRRVTGLLVDRTPDRVRIRIGGIETDFPGALVDRVQVLAPVLERYRSMREAIDPGDVEQILRLAEWLRTRERFDLALVEIERALAVSPTHAEARRMKALVEGQVELLERARARREQPPESSDPPASPGEPDPFPLLDAAQINLIKVFEVDLKSPPNLLIERDTITRLLTQYAGDPLIPATAEGRDQMYRMSPVKVLEVMFRLQARDLYDQVRVVGQPKAMELFRDNVHRAWLINGCATSRCHGGEEAGRLYLHNKRINSDPTLYTNFLILDRYRLPSGTPLINHDAPERSPLLQSGLPRRDSLYPHPEVPGALGHGDLWRPMFRSTDDRRYQQAVEWIRSLYRPRPEYPVEYTPPRPSRADPAAPQAEGGR